MALSFSQAKRVLSFALNRRGYAVASDVSSSVRGIQKKGATKSNVGPSGTSSAWAPDPVTGYYRPINHTNENEIDPVELRRMLLKHRVRSSSSSS